MPVPIPGSAFRVAPIEQDGKPRQESTAPSVLQDGSAPAKAPLAPSLQAVGRLGVNAET